jgi:hypothetical protein
MCIIGIFPEDGSEYYRSESRMGRTRPGELVGELEAGYAGYYD